MKRFKITTTKPDWSRLTTDELLGFYYNIHNIKHQNVTPTHINVTPSSLPGRIIKKIKEKKKEVSEDPNIVTLQIFTRK